MGKNEGFLLKCLILGLIFSIFAIFKQDEPYIMKKRQIDNDTEQDQFDCHPTHVRHSADPCEFITKYCPGSSRINYMKMHYCTFGGEWFSYIFIILFLFFYFYVVGQMTDRFFIPSLSRIAKGLQMSQSLAGVTLLSLGNGAPDIFATIEAVRSESYEQAFGQVVGAASFISLGITSLLSITALIGAYQTARRPFLRDVGFLIIGLCAALWLVHDFKITFWEPYILLLVYLIYVITVVVGKLVYKHFIKDVEIARELVNEYHEKLKLLERLEFREFPTKKDRNYPYIKLLVNEDNRDLIRDLKFEKTPLVKEITLQKIAETLDYQVLTKIVEHYEKKTKPSGLKRPFGTERINEDEEPLIQLIQPKTETLEEESIVILTNNEPSHTLFERLKQYIDWDRKSTSSRIILILTSPLLILEHFTIHWGEEGKYLRELYIIHPPAIILFIFFLFDIWTAPITISGKTLGYWIYWIAPLSALLSFIVYLSTNPHKPPKYNAIFIASGAISSAMWIDLFASELVSSLGTLGKLFGVSDAVMGLTIMAWGNSLSDLITDILISQRGYAAMVTSAVYSSPITHVLIGLGLSFIIKISQSGTIHLTTLGWEPDLTNTLWINFVFLIFGLLLTLIVVPISGFRFTRFFGSLLLIVYISSIGFSLLDLFNVFPSQVLFWRM